jgi:hypothetical protein
MLSCDLAAMHRMDMEARDISPDFIRATPDEKRALRLILKHEATPEAKVSKNRKHRMNINFDQLTEQHKMDLCNEANALMESEKARADKAELQRARLQETILEIIIVLAGFNVALWIAKQ